GGGVGGRGGGPLQFQALDAIFKEGRKERDHAHRPGALQRHRQPAKGRKRAQGGNRRTRVPHLHRLQTLPQQQKAPPDVSLFFFTPGGGADSARQYKRDRGPLLQRFQPFGPGCSTVLFGREKRRKVAPSNRGPLPPLFIIQDSDGESGRCSPRVRQQGQLQVVGVIRLEFDQSSAHTVTRHVGDDFHGRARIGCGPVVEDFLAQHRVPADGEGLPFLARGRKRGRRGGRDEGIVDACVNLIGGQGSEDF